MPVRPTWVYDNKNTLLVGTLVFLLALRLLGSVNPLLLLLSMYVIASILWSIDSSATFRRSLHFVVQ